MKSKVRFSAYCVIVTVAVVALFLIGIVATRHQSDKCIGLSVIAVVTTLAGLFYCPMSVSTDSNSVKIHRLLSGCKTFKYSDIEAVDTCYPSAGGLRLCGSGGFFGSGAISAIFSSVNILVIMQTEANVYTLN